MGSIPLALAALGAGAQNLVVNGDFEPQRLWMRPHRPTSYLPSAVILLRSPAGRWAAGRETTPSTSCTKNSSSSRVT